MHNDKTERMRKRKILRDTAIKRVPIWPGYMAVEVDEHGKEAGPIDLIAILLLVPGFFLLFGAALALVVLFHFIEILLGVNPV